MDVLEFGRSLLLLANIVTGGVFLLSLLGILIKDRRPVMGARTGLYALCLLLCTSAGCLVYGFVTGQYNVDYIYNYSEVHLPTFFKMAGLWAGLDGSVLFWTMLLGCFCALVALQHRKSSQHPTGRRLEPYVYLVLSVVMMFFVVISYHQNPFAEMSPEMRLRLASLHNVAVDDSGNFLDGHGLNPQLVNYWFVIHPPCLYLGFIIFTVPFAFAMAALMAGELGDYWIRVVRRWTMVAWLFLTSGIILGGLWAYRQLGWGGYWAWDPVENASFLPWCTGTAFLHSVMVQERRDMLKSWNAFLVILTFFLTIWGTWMTRSGVVESVHAFAGGDIGIWFQGFLILIGSSGLFLIFYRWREMRGTNRFDSLLSRESVFLLNNVVLVVIAASVLMLSMFTKITHDFFAQKGTVSSSHYNSVMTPLFAALLFLTAIGPGLGWVKTSPSALKRNFLKPAIATVLFLLFLYGWWFATGTLGTWREVLVPGGDTPHATAFYPTGLLLGLSFFIAATLSGEFLRSMRSRVVFRKQGVVTAFFQLVVRNNRRWGGYAVHLGIATLAVGIVSSSMFRVQKQLTLKLGESAIVGPYRITPTDSKRTEPGPGEPYVREEVVFRVTRVPQSTMPAAHGQTGGAAIGSAEGEELVTELRPELRYYPKKDEWIKEVSIERRILGDIYIYYAARDEQGRFVLTVFLNPLMILIYLGWFTMVGGGIFAALPIPGSKVGLSD